MTSFLTPGAIAGTLAAIRGRAPLIHNITNAVVTNFTANALLALGASPAMVDGADEVQEFVLRCDALVINLGTMSADRAAAIRLAVGTAAGTGTPWVLDPVAAGVLGYRTRLAHDLLSDAPAAIRGNASEILSLTGEDIPHLEQGGVEPGGRGVDAVASSDSAREAGRMLAAETGAIVAVTGATDYVTDGVRMIALANGHPMMTRVTGMGCAATAIAGACLAVEPDRLAATLHALAITAIAGEIAAARARGPGSLAMEWLDALHGLNEAALGERLLVEEM
jgi:hydroxyethylthiazole kinase